MKYHEKLYVGFQKTRYEADEEYRILGFATPYEENAAGEKRRNTVDHWADKKIKSEIIDNVAKVGFKIVDFASRCTTDNKLIRVKDPRGFELEISVANAVGLIKETVINKGEFLTPLVWLRDKNVNYLATEEHPVYKERNANKEAKVGIASDVGAWYKDEGGRSFFRYIGKIWVVDVELLGNDLLDVKGCKLKFEYDYSHRCRDFFVLSGQETTTHGVGYYARTSIKEVYEIADKKDIDITFRVEVSHDKKPYHVYQEYALDYNGDWTVFTRSLRQPMKNLILLSGEEDQIMEIKASEVYTEDYPDVRYGEKYGSNWSRKDHIGFTNKADRDAYELDHDKVATALLNNNFNGYGANPRKVDDFHSVKVTQE